MTIQPDEEELHVIPNAGAPGTAGAGFRTPAPSPAEQAVIDRFGMFDAEERVARAILRAVLGDTDGGLVLDGDLPASEIARLIREKAAAAAIAAMPVSPAEEALRRVEAVLAEGDEYDWNGTTHNSRIRAAIAAPH